MTEREHRLVKELVKLGRFYTDCQHTCIVTNDGAESLSVEYPAEQMLRLIREFAMEADKNDD